MIRSFIKSIHNINIKKIAAQSLTFAIRLFFVLYIIVEKAWCIKFEVEKLDKAEVKDAELQYYKNLAKKCLQLLLQSQAYNYYFQVVFNLKTAEILPRLTPDQFNCCVVIISLIKPSLETKLPNSIIIYDDKQAQV